MTEPAIGPLSTEIFHTIRGVASLPALALDVGRLPRGEGRTVLVIPGYLATDFSTIGLRTFLRCLGYDALGWGLGRNQGQVGPLAKQVAARVAALPGPVSLIGWSLGGVIAREATRLVPVDRVITLGTPITGGPLATRFAGRYRRQGADLDAITRRIEARNAVPLSVPVVGLYSKVDGIVAWRACVDPNSANDFKGIEVHVGHYALCNSRETLGLVARLLAR